MRDACIRSIHYLPIHHDDFHFIREDLYKMDAMIVLMHTDLPLPVAPAISTWGIFARSHSTTCRR